jgi:hypothetical protein
LPSLLLRDPVPVAGDAFLTDTRHRQRVHLLTTATPATGASALNGAIEAFASTALNGAIEAFASTALRGVLPPSRSAGC